jgi:hypothetical protein
MKFYLNKTTWTNQKQLLSCAFSFVSTSLCAYILCQSHLLHQTRINLTVFHPKHIVQGISVNALTSLPSCVMYLLDLWLVLSCFKLFQLSCLWEGCSLGLINLV